MTHMLVRHKVADFREWKRVLDSHAEAQKKAGLTLEHLWHNIVDPNEIFILMAVADIDKARAFVSAPDASDAQQTSGVLDTPDLYFLTEIA